MRQKSRIRLFSRYVMPTMALLWAGFSSAAWGQVNSGLLVPDPANIPLSEQLKKQEQNLVPSREQPEIKLNVPEAPAIVELSGSRFQIRKIKIQGNTLLSETALHTAVAGFEGRVLSLNDLEKAVEIINDRYRKLGYLTSIAYIPPQDISQGEVIIQVLEGTVGDISVAGNRYYRTGSIARYLDQGTGDPFSISRLEKNLRRMNRQGDYRIRATLSPNTQPGRTNVRLDVEERPPVQVSLTYDNQGRPTIGTQRWGAEVTHRNLTGIGDRLTARWIGAAGTQAILGSYFVPLNRYGTELGATFGFSRVNVDLSKHSSSRDTIIGESINYGLTLSQPLDRNHVFVTDASLNFRRVTSWLNGDRDSTQDDIRSLQFGLNFDKSDHWGRTFIRAQTALGTAWMGGNRQFWKANTLVNRIVRLPKNNFLIIRSFAQFTPDALPPAEQFQLGGAYSVRGYSEGVLVADRGYQFSVEHRWPVPYLRLLSPWLSERLQGATFFDYGRTWMDNSNTRTPRRKENMLAGAGLGLRIRLTRAMQGFVDFGFGLVPRSDIEPNAQPTARIHFGIRSDLLADDYKTRGKTITPVTIKPRHSRIVRQPKRV